MPLYITHRSTNSAKTLTRMFNKLHTCLLIQMNVAVVWCQFNAIWFSVKRVKIPPRQQSPKFYVRCWPGITEGNLGHGSVRKVVFELQSASNCTSQDCGQIGSTKLASVFDTFATGFRLCCRRINHCRSASYRHSSVARCDDVTGGIVNLM